MENLVLKPEDLKTLNDLVGNIPTRYGMPLVQFFNLIEQKRKLEQKQESEPAKKQPLGGQPKMVQERPDQETVKEKKPYTLKDHDEKLLSEAFKKVAERSIEKEWERKSNKYLTDGPTGIDELSEELKTPVSHNQLNDHL